MGNAKRFGKTLLWTIVTLCLIVVLFVVFGFKSFSDDNVRAPESLDVATSQEVIFDPLQANSSQEFFTASLTSATLLNGDKENGVKPGIAKSYTLSNNAAQITIDLGDATFSNGDKITSSDVKATYERLAQANISYRNLLSNIKGFGEAKTGKDFFGISDAKQSEVVISLITPDPYFLFHLTHPATAILSSKAILKDGISTAISSGKYTVDAVNNEVGKTTIYKPRDSRLPIVNVKRMEQTELEDKALDADIALGVNSGSSYGRVSVPQLALATWNIYVDNSSSPLGDVRLRKAILLAISSDETIAPYGSNAVEPSDFGGGTYDATNCSKNCQSDVDEAKEIVKDLYPKGDAPTINIDVEGNDLQKKLAASAAEELSEIGIPTIIKEHTTAELSNLIARGEVQLYRFGWVPDVPLMGEGLVAGFKADSPDNISGIVDVKLEDKIESYLNTKTVSSRKDASIAIQDRLKDLWVVRPIAVFQDVISVDKSISDVNIDFYGRINMSDIRMEKE